MVEELFADLPRFTRYVQRLSRLSMPGADLIRFEHVQALVRSGHAAVLRSFVLCVAQGRVPAEARPIELMNKERTDLLKHETWEVVSER